MSWAAAARARFVPFLARGPGEAWRPVGAEEAVVTRACPSHQERKPPSATTLEDRSAPPNHFVWVHVYSATSFNALLMLWYRPPVMDRRVSISADVARAAASASVSFFMFWP